MATREKPCGSSPTRRCRVCAWCGYWIRCGNDAEHRPRIQVDNGTEFTSRVVDQWAYQNQVALHFIERGKPTQNALIESFNGKFRDECLNQNWFVYLRDAREVIESWRVDYNTVRPHSSLRYLTPEEFAASAAARPASPPTPVVSSDPAWAGSDVQEPRSANL